MSDRALLTRVAFPVRVRSRPEQVGSHLWFLESPIGQRFSSGGQAENCVVVLEFPVWRACLPGV